MEFYEWILQFTDEESPVGDLAYDIKRDPRFPKNNDYDDMQWYISTKPPYVMSAFKEAYKRFLDSTNT